MIAWMDELRDAVDRFLDRHGVAPSRLGKAAVNDANLVFEVRGGRAITLPKADRVRAYIRGFDDGAAHARASVPPAVAGPADPPPQLAGGAEGADAAGHGQPGGAAARQGGEIAGQSARELEQGVG